MQTVFILEHVYEMDDKEEIKFIGVFSSSDKAQAAIESLKNILGFNKHSIECFQIHETKLDEFEWKEGFINWKEAL